MTDWVVALSTAKSAPPEAGRASSLLMKHGTMTLRYYAPKQIDRQTPHTQDEVYIVAAGSGFVVSGPREDALEKRAFGPGDAVFVPAGHVHRFVDFTEDFGTWVVFWGPDGGEAA